MGLPFEGYEAELKALMDRAFENACASVRAATAGKGSDSLAVRTIISVNILLAVRKGERDERRLTLLALQAVRDLC
jgi:hypothetical protein